MKFVAPLLAAALLAAAPGVHAQAQKGFDCSQAKDPKACEERREKMRAAYTQAEKACEGRQGAERRECMMKEMCAQAKDAKACEARMSRMKDSARGARAACEGKRGEEHDECMVKEMCAQAKDPARCESEGRGCPGADMQILNATPFISKMPACDLPSLAPSRFR